MRLHVRPLFCAIVTMAPGCSDEPPSGTGGAGAGEPGGGGVGGCAESCGGGGAGGAGAGHTCEQSLLTFAPGPCGVAANNACCDEMQACEVTPGCEVSLICALTPNFPSPCPENMARNEVIGCLNSLVECAPSFGICTSAITISETCDACLTLGCCDAFIAAANADRDGFVQCLNGDALCDDTMQSAVDCTLARCADECPPVGG